MDLRNPDLTQAIRVLDVFAIGPLMIFAGAKANSIPKAARGALAVFGVTTIVYNGLNYLDTRDEVDP